MGIGYTAGAIAMMVIFYLIAAIFISLVITDYRKGNSRKVNDFLDDNKIFIGIAIDERSYGLSKWALPLRSLWKEI